MTEENLPPWLIKALQEHYISNPEKIELWRDMVKVCWICEDPIHNPEPNHDQCISCRRWTCHDHITCEEISGRPELCDVCLHKCSVCGHLSGTELKICDSYGCGISICEGCLRYSGDGQMCSCGDEHSCCKKCWEEKMCAGICGKSVAGPCWNNVTCRCVLCLPIIEVTGKMRVFCGVCWSEHKQNR